ncbi:hypothetical protein ACOWLX_05645 [Helicobacter pylori]
MAYFESITAGRGGLDSFNQALNNQRYANLILNESLGNFANTIANAGSLFDNAKIRKEALKYQKMRDLANDKKQAEAFDLQKRQAEQSMVFAKMQQAMNEQMHDMSKQMHEQNKRLNDLKMKGLAQDFRMNEQMHEQNKRLNDLKMKGLAQDFRMNEEQYRWLMNAKPNANNTQSVLNTQRAPKPKAISKEDFKALYADPIFRY